MSERRIAAAYQQARERYAEVGVDTEEALARLAGVSLSLHCWQGDDVAGFERPGAALSGGGIQVTGSHPGRARTPEELRSDLKQALSLVPGRHRVNLHAIYGEFGGRPVDRDEIAPEHYRGWVDWARAEGLALDFNATCFSHPKAASGLTLSHPDAGVRDFWIEHVKRCRAIGAYLGRQQGGPCVHNLWVPDGSKDLPADRWGPRARLRDSLDAVYAVEYDPRELKDAVESKLFGIGAESYTVGSHEFYLAYGLLRGKMICLDLGHFHPTESVADKLSSLLLFCDEVLLHISRGVRWDSDHAVILSDEVRAVMEEIVRGDALGRAHLALDYFDASINRVGAWVIGARAALEALLVALLEPRQRILEAERAGEGFARLAWMEQAKLLPFGAVWDEHCRRAGAPAGEAWIAEVREYGERVLSRRG